MAARFRVVDAFHLESRRYFVIVGDILEGIVRAGMEIVFFPETLGVIRRRIISIEFVDGVERKAWLGLVMKYDSDEDLKTLRALDLKGCELDISDGASLH